MEIRITKVQLSPADIIRGPTPKRKLHRIYPRSSEVDQHYYAVTTNRFGKFRVDGILVRTGQDILKRVNAALRGIDFSCFKDTPVSDLTSLANVMEYMPGGCRGDED